MNTLRKIAKRVVFAIAIVLIAPAAALALLEKGVSNSRRIFCAFAELLALIPTIIGAPLRAAYYVMTLDSCDWEVTIGFGSVVNQREARLAKHVSMGNYCVLGYADIGTGTRLASRVSIPSGKRQHINHAGQISDASQFDRVEIGNYCWVGEGAIVLASVGSQCIVSAGSVVVNEMPSNKIVAGNPAKAVNSTEYVADGT